MEAKEDMMGGVSVVGAEAPSNYQVAPRSDAPTQTPSQPDISPTGAGALTPVSVGMPGLMEKKKRGRPRKYGPNGSVSTSYSPMPISASAPPSIGGYPSGKRGRGKSGASDAKQQPRFEMVSRGKFVFILIINAQTSQIFGSFAFTLASILFVRELIYI